MEALPVLVVVVVLVVVGLVVVAGVVVSARWSVDRVVRGATSPGADALELAQRQRSLDELAELRSLVGQLQRDLAVQAHRTVELTGVAADLSSVLSDSRARGQWGERLADDVLRAAGLVEGVSYSRQRTLGTGTRPDVTFFLPHDRVLHMDVKFPLDNHRRAQAATSAAEQVAAQRAFVADVRARVRELAARRYGEADDSVGYVLLFVPNEAVYAAIHELDPDLVDEALARGVVPCSPLTLFAVLAVVRHAVEAHLLEQRTDEILEHLGAFEHQWRAFTERLDRVGAQLQTVQRSWEELTGPRRRQLERPLDRIDRLRGRTRPDDAKPLRSLDAEPVASEA